MAEETNGAAPGTTQEQASPSGTTPAAFSSFLGVEAESLPSLQPEHKPEPTGEPQEAAGEEAAEQAPEELEAEAEPREEEASDDWLPTEQEKEFPLDVLTKFGKRYGYTPEEIQADPRLQNTLKDKLNSDIYIQQFNQEAENPEFEETTPEVQEAATETADPQTSYYKNVDAIVQGLDQKAASELGKGLLEAFGVNTDVAKLDQMLANPKLTPEQRVEIQGAKTLAQNASKVGTTLARGAVDLMLTTLPTVMPQLLESVAPGLIKAFGDYQERTTYASAWQEVTSKTDAQGQAIYSKLPAYGTKEFGTLVKKAESTLGLQAGALGAMVFRGQDGKPLPMADQARQAYALVAKVASGQKVAPAVVQRAVTAGRVQERTQQQRRATGRALGAGQTSRQFEQPEETDPVRDALHQAIAEQNAQANPFVGARNLTD